jgi:hypothetical protein
MSCLLSGEVGLPLISPGSGQTQVRGGSPEGRGVCSAKTDLLKPIDRPWELV